MSFGQTIKYIPQVSSMDIEEFMPDSSGYFKEDDLRDMECVGFLESENEWNTEDDSDLRVMLEETVKPWITGTSHLRQKLEKRPEAP